MTAEHTHNYNTFILKRIERIQNDHYIGAAGDKAFILAVCQCKKYKAHDYGAFRDMEAKMEPLTTI